MWLYSHLWGHGEPLGDRWSRHVSLGNQELFRPNHRDKEMSEEEDPVPLIRGSGKDPPFTFAPAVKWSFHICVGSWRNADTCVCSGWTFFFFSFLTILLINLFGQPIRSTTEQPKHLHVPWPAACFRAFYFWEHANILLWWIEMLPYGTLPSSVKRRPETLRPLQTQWAFGWRCVPKMNLTCTHFQSAEVQSFFQPAPTFSFTHTILTVGFDPGNVIQMSCVMGATAFTEEVEKSAHCMRTGATGTLIFHRRGQREWNAFSRNCFFFPQIHLQVPLQNIAS